jgi:predicted nucleic acid-binding protein
MSDDAGVLDTNALILIDRLDPAYLPADARISTVTLAELAVGPLIAQDEAERQVREARLRNTEAEFESLPFDADAARSFAMVSASLRRAGRKTKARSFDALIAATALANDLPVYTCNPRDFDSIDGLRVEAIAHPDGTLM